MQSSINRNLLTDMNISTIPNNHELYNKINRTDDKYYNNHDSVYLKQARAAITGGTQKWSIQHGFCRRHAASGNSKSQSQPAYQLLILKCAYISSVRSHMESVAQHLRTHRMFHQSYNHLRLGVCTIACSEKINQCLLLINEFHNKRQVVKCKTQHR